MARLILGRHPQGAFGLFISKPGVAVENVAPGDPNLHFSTAWGDIVNIIAAGTMAYDQTVTLPNFGFRPYLRVEEKRNIYAPLNVTGFQVNINADSNRRYDYTKYMPVYLNDTQFKIQLREPTLGGAPTGSLNTDFRYIAFSFPVNG